MTYKRHSNFPEAFPLTGTHAVGKNSEQNKSSTMQYSSGAVSEKLVSFAPSSRPVPPTSPDHLLILCGGLFTHCTPHCPIGVPFVCRPTWTQAAVCPLARARCKSAISTGHRHTGLPCLSVRVKSLGKILQTIPQTAQPFGVSNLNNNLNLFSYMFHPKPAL